MTIIHIKESIKVSQILIGKITNTISLNKNNKLKKEVKMNMNAEYKLLDNKLNQNQISQPTNHYK